MEKNVIITNSRRNDLWSGMDNIVKQLGGNGSRKVPGQAAGPVEWLRSYYSKTLERELSMRQTWLLINAQLAFGAAFFPVVSPWFVRAACLVWVVSALLKCKREI